MNGQLRLVRPGRAAEAPISGKSANTLPIGQLTSTFLYWCSCPGGYRHGVLCSKYITWAAGGSRGASSTPLIAGRCDNGPRSSDRLGHNLLPAPLPTEASTQNDKSETLGARAPAIAAVAGSTTGLRAAPVSAIGQASLAPPVSSESSTARHQQRSGLTISRRPCSPRKGSSA
jgi:hypothetical protein